MDSSVYNTKNIVPLPGSDRESVKSFRSNEGLSEQLLEQLRIKGEKYGLYPRPRIPLH